MLREARGQRHMPQPGEVRVLLICAGNIAGRRAADVVRRPVVVRVEHAAGNVPISVHCQHANVTGPFATRVHTDESERECLAAGIELDWRCFLHDTRTGYRTAGLNQLKATRRSENRRVRVSGAVA